MKKILLAAAACTVSMLAATPAYAQNEGRLEVRGGMVFANGSEDAVAGLAAGYDWDLGGAFVGMEISADKILEGGTQVSLGASGRLGANVGEKTKAYVAGGYSSSPCNGCESSWSGGGGVQHKITDSVYVKAEYRHFFVSGFSDWDAVIVGVGIAL